MYMRKICMYGVHQYADFARKFILNIFFLKNIILKRYTRIFNGSV